MRTGLGAPSPYVLLVNAALYSSVPSACTQAAPPAAPAESATGERGVPQARLATAASTPAVAHLQGGDGVHIASSWLDALARGDLPALTRQTAFPFELRDSGAEGQCPPLTTARASTELAAAVSCVLSDEMFTSVLREHSTGGSDPLTPKGLQPWARPWRGSLDPRWKLVTGYFSRPDAYLEVDVAIAEDGVRALWKTGMDGRQAAALARSWIAALRAKDVSALTRLSTFPFELRDRGRHASCGRRTAGKPDELPGTLSCLLNSEVLHRALLESLESPAIVARADDEPPEWAAAWLNTRLGPPSTRVGMLVATSAGDEFELVMLLSDSGVHAVYEWGGFEATE